MTDLPAAWGEKNAVTSSSRIGQPRGSQSQRVGGEVDPAAPYPPFKLGRAIAAVVETRRHTLQVGEEIEVDAGLARQVCPSAKAVASSRNVPSRSGSSPPCAGLYAVRSRGEAVDGVGDQVEVAE